MGKKSNIKSKKGFTIIEVVLVLAIAGLIFLMVFIALPALQRSQRNTQRRDDYSMLVTAVNNYMASNNGKLGNLAPATGKKALDANKWINSTGEDPNGNTYQLSAITVSNLLNAMGATLANGSVNVSGVTKLGNLISSTNPGSPVYIVVKANCSGIDTDQNPFPNNDNSARAFAVYGYLEGGSVFCQDSGSNNS